ncbi:MAG: FtsX-like permease family protein [Bacteroidota bacterium]
MAKTNLPWLLKMAYRDSRHNRGKLFLFISSIIVGIAALVAINSFGENLQQNINQEARSLLAADLLIQGQERPNDSLALLFDSLEVARQANSAEFPSFVRFPKTNDSRLAQVSAVKGDYPLYGTLKTRPESAATTFKTDGTALIEDAIAEQFGVEIGDEVMVGRATFEISGIIERVPGRSSVSSAFAPVVMIDYDAIEATGLLKFGTMIEYRYYLAFDDDVDVDALAEERLEEQFEERSLRYETVEDRKESYGQAFGILTNFLNLVAFMALLLGCIGVASSVHIYVKDKLPSVAVMRCLGASGKEAFLIFLLQIVVIGFVGGLLGSLLGTLLQQILPIILKDFLPMENVETDIAWQSVGQGMLTGVLVSVLFALLPLLSVRRVSPLRSLRSSYEQDVRKRDPLKWLVYVGIVAFVGGFTAWQVGFNLGALFFTLAIAVSLGMLFGMAKLLMWVVKKFFPKSWSYVWRQSIANLYRPNNQTIVLMIAIGLGTGLISTMYFTREMILQQIEQSSSSDKPNMVLFNIQNQELDSVINLVNTEGLPVINEVHMVDARITAIDGIAADSLMCDTIADVPSYLLDRTIQVSYRNDLYDNEEIDEGKWHGNIEASDEVYISLDESIARRLNAEVDTEILFSVDGKEIATRVGSIRDVKEEALTPNFPILFQEGVLEEAPQINLVTSRTDSLPQVNKFQTALVQQFPSVTLFDLRSIMQALDSILERIAFVIRFMALFSILTGIIVLISSVILSKYQRIQESVLLRTIGASRRQILLINALEYFFLGGLAVLTGMILSIISSALLANFAFDIPFRPNWWLPILWFVGITSLTVIIGLLNSREVVAKPPLEVLRKEV